MILDLFAGVGGWDEALKLLGRDDVIGLEVDLNAIAVATAAGHYRIQGDLTKHDPASLVVYGCEGLIASPPCQTFSAAGPGAGRALLGLLELALHAMSQGVPLPDALEQNGLDSHDPRTSLTLEPLRYILELDPDWIAFEEVKEALPVWEVYAHILRAIGYHVWTGVLNAADYGVPQARKRAILTAHKTRLVSRPWPTHSARGDWGLFDSREPHVTMGEALHWTAEDCRRANLLAPPEAHHPTKCLWPLTRPATTVVRSFRPDVIAAPGYRQKGDPSRQNAPGSVSLTIPELAVIQGVRPDYPFHAAAKGKQLSMVGAILPPPWGAAILSTLI